MSKRISKAPEERREELIEVASRLFEEYGYEKVSVRDILAEVNGAPGMFYYYFKSKEDIFLACMESYFSEKLKIKMDILQNKQIAYEKRIKTLRELIEKDINQFTRKCHFSPENPITDNSYRLWEFTHYIGKCVDPYADFIIEGIETGKINNPLGITKKNVKNFSAFILYGAMGTIYHDALNGAGTKKIHNPQAAFEIINRIFSKEE